MTFPVTPISTTAPLSTSFSKPRERARSSCPDVDGTMSVNEPWHGTDRSPSRHLTEGDALLPAQPAAGKKSYLDLPET